MDENRRQLSKDSIRRDSKNNQLAATMVATAYNLIRMANLLGQAA